MVIALEGLPGAGKTTAASRLAARLGCRVEEERTGEHPDLDVVYNASARDDLSVELAFLRLHADHYRSFAGDELVVSDFSPVKDLVFADQLLTGPELLQFQETFQQTYEGVQVPALAIFLDLPAEECLRRVQGRGREFEDGMDLERQSELRRRYLSHLEGLGTVVRLAEIRHGDDRESVADQLEQIARDALAGRAA